METGETDFFSGCVTSIWRDHRSNVESRVIFAISGPTCNLSAPARTCLCTLTFPVQTDWLMARFVIFAHRGSFSHSISSSSTVVQSPRSLVSVFATILSAPLRNDSFILIFLCLFSSFLNKSDTEKWSRSDGSNLLHVPTHNFLFTTARLKRNVFLYSWRCASACLMSINLNIPKSAADSRSLIKPFTNICIVIMSARCSCT